jgi:hypothetical protein
MKRANAFYFIFILTILAIRTWVFFFPAIKIIFNGTIIHHFFIGLILILSAVFLTERHAKWRIVPFAVGLGLVADELVYIVLGAGAVSKYYWSIYSVSGAIIMAVIVFLVRKRLTIRF